MDVKKTLGLLNGLSKRIYFSEDISLDFLHEQILPSSSLDEFQNVIEKFSNLLRDMVINDLDTNQVKEKLKQMQDSGQLHPNECNGIIKFWKVNRSKLHDVVVQQSLWEDKIKSFSWRIDVATQAKSIDKINKPTAIVEIKSNSMNDIAKDSETLLFEMDQQQVQQVLNSINEIDETIAKYNQ